MQSMYNCINTSTILSLISFYESRKTLMCIIYITVKTKFAIICPITVQYHNLLTLKAVRQVNGKRQNNTSYSAVQGNITVAMY